MKVSHKLPELYESIFNLTGRGKNKHKFSFIHLEETITKFSKIKIRNEVKF